LGQGDKADISELIESEATKEGKNFCSLSVFIKNHLIASDSEAICISAS
jgi:hypothetical protein